MIPTEELHFDLGGCRVLFSCGDSLLSFAVAASLSAFSAPPGHPDISISAELGTVSSAGLSPALFSTRRWKVLKAPAGRRLVWYPEGAVCEYDFRTRTGRLRSADRALLEELSYLLILSRAGEELDLAGLHRLHAGALGHSGRALLFCGPRGSGKTTLLLELLKDSAFSLLSDDTPLVSADGSVLPFPARVGLALDSPHLPGFGGLRRLERRHYPPKRLLDTVKAGFRLAGPLPPGALFLLRRSERARIRRAAIPAAAAELAVSLAVGWGVPQLAEYFLRAEPEDLLRKGGILASRLRAAARLLRRSGRYIFELSPDHERNAQELRAFLGSGSAQGARGL